LVSFEGRGIELIREQVRYSVMMGTEGSPEIWSDEGHQEELDYVEEYPYGYECAYRNLFNFSNSPGHILKLEMFSHQSSSQIQAVPLPRAV